ILCSRSADNGATWTPPMPLNANAARDRGPDDQPFLLAAGTGRFIAIWRSEDDLDGHLGFDGDILFAESMDGGTTWSQPQPVNNDADSDFLRDSHAYLFTRDDGG